MANPWDDDEDVGAPAATVAAHPAARGARNPWDDDEDISSHSIDNAPPATYPGAAQIMADANAAAPRSTGFNSDGSLDINGAPDAVAPTDNPANHGAFAGMLTGEKAPPAKPSLFRMDSDYDQHAGTGFFTRLGASARDMFAGHESAAKYLADKAGGTIDKAADGSPVVVLPDGSRYRVNDEGLDSTDVGNVAGNVAATFTPAGWASDIAKARQLGLLGRAALQAGTAAATDATLQGAATAATGDFEVDPSRVALAGIGGAGGEVAGTALSATARTLGGAARAVTGSGKAEARQLAQEAGIADPSPEVVNQFARSLEQARSGAPVNPNALVGESRFGLRYTQGQRMTDGARRNAQLNREEVLASTPGGEAKFTQLADRNRQTVNNFIESNAERLGGQRGLSADSQIDDAASALQAQAKSLDDAISAAYTEAGKSGRTAVNSEAVATLPARLREATRDFGLDPQLTPAASRTLEDMTNAARELETMTPGARTSGVTVKALETQRRILNSRINAAANATDRAALVAMKREFDGMIDEAFDQGLTKGDPGAIEVMKRARGLRAEFARRFEGKADTDRFIGSLLDGSKTPQELVNVALGAGKIARPGAARFIERLKLAANDDPAVLGPMRAANFLRMTQNAKGEPLAFGDIISSIKATAYSRDNVVSALYTPQQWKDIQTLAGALDPLVAKGARAKSSGTAERAARMLSALAGRGFGIPGAEGFAKAITNVRNEIAADTVINAPLRLNAQAAPIVNAVGAGMAADAGR